MKLKLIQAFIVVNVTCKNEEVLLKMKATESSQHLSHYKSLIIFSDAQVQSFPQALV